MALITQREVEFKKRLEDPGSFATVLLAILLDEYTTDVFSWEPQAIYMQLKDDFHVDVAAVNRDKIGAGITVLTTNQFFINSDIFANVCKAFAHGEADFSTFRPLSPEELAWGVTEAVLNNPPRKDLGNEEFSSEVANMVGICLFNQGILKPPRALQFAEYPTTNPVEDIELMFADDPTMFEAAMANQNEAAADIDEFVKHTLVQMYTQLESLPLSHKMAGGAKKTPPA